MSCSRLFTSLFLFLACWIIYALPGFHINRSSEKENVSANSISKDNFSTFEACSGTEELRDASFSLSQEARQGSPFRLVSFAGEDRLEESKSNSGAEEKKSPIVQEENSRSSFGKRNKAPEFEEGMDWINSAGPIELKDLRGKFVVLDFWTHCCINCMHILPELKKLEKAYPNNVVVIGVHSAKFAQERDTQSIVDAVQRYEIEHPVINDSNLVLWRTYGADVWPSIRIIDPEGFLIHKGSGEKDFKFETLNQFFKKNIKYYGDKGLLNEEPIRFDLEVFRSEPTPLRFPGKILADLVGGRLFIADSNHNRIVMTSLDGALQEVIGTGAIGSVDGDFTKATFNHPQGMALHKDTLYVADTENHLIREVDLKKKKVQRIAGTGKQGYPWRDSNNRGFFNSNRPPIRPARSTELASPWDLWIHGEEMYIAMAGSHQIWKMKVGGKDIGIYSGNGKEDIVDGPLLSPLPGQPGFASYAQPSGLTSDGFWLYVADSEGSSIRAVPLDSSKPVGTVVGTSGYPPEARLFTYGDQDGRGQQVLLQHPLGVAYQDSKIYVADTYNNKIKVIDLQQKSCVTLLGDGKPGDSDSPARFDQPSGISAAGTKLYVADTNNHIIRVIHLDQAGLVTTLNIPGLEPPAISSAEEAPDLESKEKLVEVEPATLKAEDKTVRLAVRLTLPEGYKINSLAPMSFRVAADDLTGPFDKADFAKPIRVQEPSVEPVLELPVTGMGAGKVNFTLVYYYCRDGAEGVCKVGSARWSVPLTVSDSGKENILTLSHEVK